MSKKVLKTELVVLWRQLEMEGGGVLGGFDDWDEIGGS